MRFNKLIPELYVKDFKKSLEFYTDALGFTTEYQREGFAFLSLQGSQMMIQEMSERWSTGSLEYPFGRGMNLQIMVKDIRPIIRSLKEKHHRIFQEPKDNWYRKDDTLLGNREFLVQDPDGYLLRFSQDIGSKKA